MMKGGGIVGILADAAPLGKGDGDGPAAAAAPPAPLAVDSVSPPDLRISPELPSSHVPLVRGSG